MTAADDIKITKVKNSKLADLDANNLPFGKYFTDHMLEVNYKNGEWGQLEIKPYQPISIDPACAAIHYGQSIFEGIKAYKNEEGETFIFRPIDNFKRFNISAERMEMPQVPEEIFMRFGRDAGSGRLLTPGHDGTDGFFVARWRAPC